MTEAHTFAARETEFVARLKAEREAMGCTCTVEERVYGHTPVLTLLCTLPAKLTRKERGCWER
jgi:hypothetical protein